MGPLPGMKREPCLVPLSQQMCGYYGLSQPWHSQQSTRTSQSIFPFAYQHMEATYTHALLTISMHNVIKTKPQRLALRAAPSVASEHTPPHLLAETRTPVPPAEITLLNAPTQCNATLPAALPLMKAPDPAWWPSNESETPLSKQTKRSLQQHATQIEESANNLSLCGPTKPVSPRPPQPPRLSLSHPETTSTSGLQEYEELSRNRIEFNGAAFHLDMNNHDLFTRSLSIQLRTNSIRSSTNHTPSENQVPASAYSSLLPEWHCPPYADMSPTLESSSPSSQDAPSPRDLNKSQITHDAPLEENQRHGGPGMNCRDSSQRNFSSPVSCLRQSCEPRPSLCVASTQPGQETSWQVENDPYDGSPESTNNSHSHFDPSYHGICLDVHRKRNLGAPRKRPKRGAVDRPLGLPLGPWTPNDPIPPSSVMHPKKPRKVRRAPSNVPVLKKEQGGAKVSCPKCSTLLLRKSLNRHLERHSNWTEGKYDAHLFCRFCFSAYSRRDSLVRHQKTDLQCVKLQHSIYSQSRGRTFDVGDGT